MLKIGWSSKDISTDKPINIPGQFYAKVSRGIHDRIYITALYIADENDCVIFLSADAVSVTYDIITEIRNAVKSANSSIPADKIILSATHTHTSPSFNQNDILSQIPVDDISIYPSAEYRKFFVESAKDAVIESFYSLKEGSFSYGYDLVAIAHSRRVEYNYVSNNYYSSFWVDGKVKMYGETNDACFSGYEGGGDSFINILFTFDKSKNLTGALINIPCPAQTSEDEYYISAGYWNEIRSFIRREYGDIFILPHCGAAGDLSPRILHCKKAQERRFNLKYDNIQDDFSEIKLRYDIAEKVKIAFDDVLSWSKKDICSDAKIIHKVKNISVPMREISDEEYKLCLEKYEEAKNIEFVHTDIPAYNIYCNSKKVNSKNRYKGVLDRYQRQQKTPNYPVEVHIVKLGDIAFVTCPFELFIDFQHRIQARSPFIQTFVTQLCANPDGYAGGYLATAKATENRGYSASLFSNIVSSEGGDIFTNDAVDELLQLYDK